MTFNESKFWEWYEGYCEQCAQFPPANPFGTINIYTVHAQLKACGLRFTNAIQVWNWREANQHKLVSIARKVARRYNVVLDLHDGKDHAAYVQKEQTQ
jgi:hypothetical protein